MIEKVGGGRGGREQPFFARAELAAYHGLYELGADNRVNIQWTMVFAGSGGRQITLVNGR